MARTIANAEKATNDQGSGRDEFMRTSRGSSFSRLGVSRSRSIPPRRFPPLEAFWPLRCGQRQSAFEGDRSQHDVDWYEHIGVVWSPSTFGGIPIVAVADAAADRIVVVVDQMFGLVAPGRRPTCVLGFGFGIELLAHPRAALATVGPRNVSNRYTIASGNRSACIRRATAQSSQRSSSTSSDRESSPRRWRS